MADITLRVNGTTCTGSPEARKTLRTSCGTTSISPAPTSAASTGLRCMYGHRRRPGGALVPDAGGPGRRPRGNDHRGLAPDGGLGTLQQAMWDSHSFQCGFCTPGFVMQATAFLTGHPDASEQQIREALSGNICRCTGYQSIIDGVLLAAERNRER